MSASYPESAADRARWILARRGPREVIDPRKPVGALVERERTETGAIASVATIFLANRECPWRCLMCDLWRHTLDSDTPAGGIPGQIDAALAALPPAARVKLYNAGSFFDPRAVPRGDYAAIASRLAPFERVVVESHPALVGDDRYLFAKMLDGDLEVAMGLETAHPEVLALLNKGMTVDSFRAAADTLAARDIALRVFLLLGLPFASRDESLEWAARSLDVAFDAGATAAVLIPTRSGNGAMDALAREGRFTEPTLADIETALARAFSDHGHRGRIFADLWDLGRFASCRSCFEARRQRLEAMNLAQEVAPAVGCPSCGGSA